MVSDDPKEITYDEYIAGRTNFDNHYFVLNSSSEQVTFYGQDFYFAWADLQNAVSNYCNMYSINQEDVAVRLVHCFNSTTSTIYMRMQLCKMVPGLTSTEGGLGTQEFLLVSDEEAWYEIGQSMIQLTGDHQLHDSVYLNDFYYSADLGSTPYVQLSTEPDIFVRNFTYPWYTEILAMYEANDNPMNAMIHFAACSYVVGPEASNVTYPHGNVLYLSVNDVPLLNNDDYLVMFKNKGADNATLCPPKCNVYIA